MRAEVQRYYGEVLQSSADLKTDACCTADMPAEHVRAALAEIHDEVLSRYYGCGLVLPDALEGLRVLDLGCGAGRDCFALSRLVGPNGSVVGVDMTREQLDVARRHVEFHRAKFGYAASNVEFIEGDIEKLDQCGLADESFDLIVSNCVINLASDKQSVIDQAWRVLKPGGELYFADIYADRRVSDELRADPVLYGECLSGALYWNDFLTIARRAGFMDPRLVDDRPVDVQDSQLMKRVGDVRFCSATWRLFKIAGLESTSENYGQAAVYRGLLAHQPERFRLDKQHVFAAGEKVPVCANTFRILAESRFAPAFDFLGGSDIHLGPFEGAGVAITFGGKAPAEKSPGCC